MKALFFALITTLSVSANAHHTDLHNAVIDACASVAPVAILAKDNMPFWSQSKDTEEKMNCYETLKTMIEQATDEQIIGTEAAFNGTLKFCGNDQEYARFIKENRVNNNEFTVEAAAQDSMTPVFKPKQYFFND